MVGHGVTTMFLKGCMVIARNGRTRWPTNLRLFFVFNLNHPMFEEKVKPFDQCQIMSSWRLCVYNIYMCVHIPTKMFHPKHPKKISGCCPKSKKKCISTAILFPNLCTPAEGAPSVNSSSAGSGLHGQWYRDRYWKSDGNRNWDHILKIILKGIVYSGRLYSWDSVGNGMDIFWRESHMGIVDSGPNMGSPGMNHPER